MFSLFTSESVCAGHPDKICDAISDAILDAVLTQDPNGRVAVEAVVSKNRIDLRGEVSTKAKVDYVAVARGVVKGLGYNNTEWGFSHLSPVDTNITTQSPEIAQGVDQDGAGDQGMMIGYACCETPEYMPLPITLAHALTRAIDDARESGKLSYLRPDGKAQVMVRYEDTRPISVEHVAIAVPHSESVEFSIVQADVFTHIVSPVLASYGYNLGPDQLVVNGTGDWHHPGPAVDTGLTGRKIVVDSYGGFARVGGGAFSGKDPSKVDRSGAYAARFLAKNIVASGLADRAEIRMAYVIGARKPIMIELETFGTSTASVGEILKYATSLLDISVKGIIDGLDLKRPIYSQTSAYGHFGQSDLPWERIIAK